MCPVGVGGRDRLPSSRNAGTNGFSRPLVDPRDRPAAFTPCWLVVGAAQAELAGPAPDRGDVADASDRIGSVVGRYPYIEAARSRDADVGE